MTESAAVARWLRRELAARRPQARSLVVTIWGDALAPHGGEVWLSTLMALLAPFGINQRLVRTSVYRLAKDGWLAAQPRGRRSRYRLTREGEQRFAQAYRRVYTSPLHRWNGRWDIVVVDGDAMKPAARKALRDELAWTGYAAIAPGVHARPMSDDAAAVALGRLSAHVVRFAGRDLADAPTQSLAARVSEAWQLGAVDVEYRRFIGRHAGVAAAFRGSPRPSPEQAFLVRTLLVHEYRRVRLHDPQLPEALLPRDWPGTAAYALCRGFYRVAAPLAEAHLAAIVRAYGGRGSCAYGERIEYVRIEPGAQAPDSYANRPERLAQRD
jgi:phenylacetic acid degradation operon negative regulatory protein